MRTIGGFDSGVGGLTVLRALLPLIPSARYVYLGDTARLPYGSKSPETVARYAVSSARFLLEQGADLLVVACNTASALALDYSHALASLGLAAFEKACPLFVPLIEEGWTDHPVTREVARIYLTESLEQSPGTTAVVLGCTHYPLIRSLLEETLAELGRPLVIIDSAEATAAAVLRHLAEVPAVVQATPKCAFYATDSVEKFRQLGSKFLGQPLPKIDLIDLGG